MSNQRRASQDHKGGYEVLPPGYVWANTLFENRPLEDGSDEVETDHLGQILLAELAGGSVVEQPVQILSLVSEGDQQQPQPRLETQGMHQHLSPLSPGDFEQFAPANACSNLSPRPQEAHKPSPPNSPSFSFLSHQHPPSSSPPASQQSTTMDPSIDPLTDPKVQQAQIKRASEILGASQRRDTKGCYSCRRDHHRCDRHEVFPCTACQERGQAEPSLDPDTFCTPFITDELFNFYHQTLTPAEQERKDHNASKAAAKKQKVNSNLAKAGYQQVPVTSTASSAVTTPSAAPVPGGGPGAQMGGYQATPFGAFSTVPGLAIGHHAGPDPYGAPIMGSPFVQQQPQAASTPAVAGGRGRHIQRDVLGDQMLEANNRLRQEREARERQAQSPTRTAYQEVVQQARRGSRPTIQTPARQQQQHKRSASDASLASRRSSAASITSGMQSPVSPSVQGQQQRRTSTRFSVPQQRQLAATARAAQQHQQQQQQQWDPNIDPALYGNRQGQ